MSDAPSKLYLREHSVLGWNAPVVVRPKEWWGAACYVPESALAQSQARVAALEALLTEARGHLRGYSMSMLARGRESLLAAIDKTLPPMKE